MDSEAVPVKDASASPSAGADETAEDKGGEPVVSRRVNEASREAGAMLMAITGLPGARRASTGN